MTKLKQAEQEAVEKSKKSAPHKLVALQQDVYGQRLLILWIDEEVLENWHYKGEQQVDRKRPASPALRCIHWCTTQVPGRDNKVAQVAYDIWGDTVNIAARVEQNGQVGQLNLSADTWKHVRKDFNCRFAGVIEAKNKGEVEIYTTS